MLKSKVDISLDKAEVKNNTHKYQQTHKGIQLVIMKLGMKQELVRRYNNDSVVTYLSS